jgi:micrococcal nuclease
MKTLPFILFILLPLCIVAQIRGKVVSVHDGDTFTLLTSENKRHKIRLYGVDCPEKDQAYGETAKSFAQYLLCGEQVSVFEKGTDRYSRKVGIVILKDGRILNEELLTCGYAWHYTQYDKNCQWDTLQQRAQVQRIGLWQGKNPIAPWMYRRHKRLTSRH